ncbi:MAG: beta-lactamase family protein [Burkholderiaceae bacterium]|nr:beta-lactamase family protein [Burkholderiaceae bacterium]
MNRWPIHRTTLLAAFVLTVLGQCAAPVAGAPDEARYGAGQGYPVGARNNWARPEFMVGSFTAMEQLFPVRAVPAGGAKRELPGHPTVVDWPFVQAYLDSHPVSGLLILKDGQVLQERYQYGRSAEHRFTSFSMAKTLVAMAVGVAVAEGSIASIDDPVDKYEPALAKSAWKGVALRQVLTMSSGVRFDETYDRRDTDIARLSRAWTLQQGSLLDGLERLTEHDAAPGARFKYASAETQVLGQVLVRATGMPLAAYIGRKIWGPMGAEADALWVLDAVGMEAAYCCLSARLRDWGRSRAAAAGARPARRPPCAAAGLGRGGHDGAFERPAPAATGGDCVLRLRLSDLDISRRPGIRAAGRARPGRLRAPAAAAGDGTDRRMARLQRSGAQSSARCVLARW